MIISFSICSLLLYSAILIAVVLIMSAIFRRLYANDTRDTMGLEEFISESIVQLMNGVTIAQEKSEVVGGAVNPHLLSHSETTDVPSVSHGNTTEIKYHLALSKSTSRDGGSKFAVRFGDNNVLGVNKNKNQTDSSLTTMSFAIRVSLPLHDNRATNNFTIEELKAVQNVRGQRDNNNA